MCEKDIEKLIDSLTPYVSIGNFKNKQQAEQYKKALLMVQQLKNKQHIIADFDYTSGNHVEISNFDTREQAEEFAKALKLILNAKGVIANDL